MCLHPSQVCDGILQCPQQDDEVLCQPSCPHQCHCQGLAWVCQEKLDPEIFQTNTTGNVMSVYTQPRYIDASFSGMSFTDLISLNLLVRLSLSKCNVKEISLSNFTNISSQRRSYTILPNLQHIDLSYNELVSIDLSDFMFLINLQVIILSNNPISNIMNSGLFRKIQSNVVNLQSNLQNTTNAQPIHESSQLTLLDLSFTYFELLNTSLLKNFPKLHTLNISNSEITTISSEGFQMTPQLEHLIAKRTPIVTFPSDVLKSLEHLSSLSTENYKLCCPVYLPDNFDVNNCEATQDLLASCDDLLKSNYYRIFLWLFAALSLMGNIVSFVARMYIDR